MEFSKDQLERYSRNLLLSGVGESGQRKIARARILVIGAGGLGSGVLFYLAAAGVGTLGIADGDAVDLTNLQRQVIHFTPDLDRPKVVSAADKIARLNPDVAVRRHPAQVTPENIMALIEDYDFVVDGTDNFTAKFLINDACVQGSKPFSHAGVLHFTGQMMTVLPGRSACYRCVFNEPPPADAVSTSSQVGILGAVAGTVGALQATEALKYVLGKGDLLTNRLLTYDALKMVFRNVGIQPDPLCPVCGKGTVGTVPVDVD